MTKPLLAPLSALLLAGCSVFGVRASYEAPDYAVVEQLGPAMEVRAYAPRLAVEATVATAAGEDGRNVAFRLLVYYISAKNRSADRIAMTVPVETARTGAKIAMTVPVETASRDGQTTMRFFLPKSYTRANAPEPLDPRIQLVDLPAATIAAATFSGSTGAAKVEGETAALLSALAGSGWQPAGPPSALFYDPPWTLWFARRNEVAVPVARR
jgi:hypothetical protein